MSDWGVKIIERLTALEEQFEMILTTMNEFEAGDVIPQLEGKIKALEEFKTSMDGLGDWELKTGKRIDDIRDFAVKDSAKIKALESLLKDYFKYRQKICKRLNKGEKITWRKAYEEEAKFLKQLEANNTDLD